MRNASFFFTMIYTSWKRSFLSLLTHFLFPLLLSVRALKAEKSSTLSSSHLLERALYLRKAVYWVALKADITLLWMSSLATKHHEEVYSNQIKSIIILVDTTGQTKSFGITQYTNVSIPLHLSKRLERTQMTQGSCHMLLGPELVWQLHWNLLLASGQPRAYLLLLF